jgi:hypothetical protein
LKVSWSLCISVAARGIDTVYQAEGGNPIETAGPNDLRRPRAGGGIIVLTIAGLLSHVLHRAARSGV